MSDFNRPVMTKRLERVEHAGNRVTYERIDDRPGRFKAWSTDHEELDGGPGHFPVAVVEFDDGSVKVLHAEFIRFLGREVTP